ncbi:hypothetical protein AGABI1DRAFT_114917 [Agaricus bisporus var. burnettii JB137-S8]|uniref:Uncharacterized protein n=1 Tax=Agaricus bisporus var. burnettii (strain JB137-S8 / ATCC MYA-4627 / FGSC 10392) TaxID=597362 RepID=K5WRU5_AGABU|nr:uncharacterized protein AGABI1DRAFT_114917 [Agaricus bisporus var. burnettii JB137-S8]EKM78086.1 hypothetical protein AGABI1DRAFT_114917 [Agaricus bisporus var. burnettii JB137-S8]
MMVLPADINRNAVTILTCFYLFHTKGGRGFFGTGMPFRPMIGFRTAAWGECRFNRQGLES